MLNPFKSSISGQIPSPQLLLHPNSPVKSAFARRSSEEDLIIYPSST